VERGEFRDHARAGIGWICIWTSMVARAIETRVAVRAELSAGRIRGSRASQARHLKRHSTALTLHCITPGVQMFLQYVCQARYRYLFVEFNPYAVDVAG
jgi:hypothetical protein